MISFEDYLSSPAEQDDADDTSSYLEGSINVLVFANIHTRVDDKSKAFPGRGATCDKDVAFCADH